MFPNVFWGASLETEINKSLNTPGAEMVEETIVPKTGTSVPKMGTKAVDILTGKPKKSK